MCGPLCYQFQQCGHVLNSGQVAPCQDAVKNNALCQGQNGRPAGPSVTRPHTGTCPSCAPIPPAQSLSDLTSTGTEEESDSNDSTSSTATINGAQAHRASQAPSVTGTASRTSNKSETSSRAASRENRRARNTRQPEVRQRYQTSHAGRNRDKSTPSVSTSSSQHHTALPKHTRIRRPPSTQSSSDSQSTRSDINASELESSCTASHDTSSQSIPIVYPPVRGPPLSQAHDDGGRRNHNAGLHSTPSDVDETSELSTTTADTRKLPERTPAGYPQLRQRQQNYPAQNAGAVRGYGTDEASDTTVSTVIPQKYPRQGVARSYPQPEQQQQQQYPPSLATAALRPTSAAPQSRTPAPTAAPPARMQQHHYLPHNVEAEHPAQAARQQTQRFRPSTPAQANSAPVQQRQDFAPQTDVHDFATISQQAPPAVPHHVHFREPAQANAPSPQRSTRAAHNTASVAGTTPSVQEWRQHDAPYIHPNSNPTPSGRARKHRSSGRDPGSSEKQLEEQRAKAAEHDLQISRARQRASQAEEVAFERDTQRAIEDSRPSLQEELEAENQIRLAMLNSLEEYTAKLEQRTGPESNAELHIYTQCGHQVQRSADAQRTDTSTRPRIEYHDKLCDNCQRYRRQPEPATACDVHTLAQPYAVPLAFRQQPLYNDANTAESSRAGTQRSARRNQQPLAGQTGVHVPNDGHTVASSSRSQQQYQPSFTPTMGVPYHGPASAFASPQRSIADLHAEPEPIERTPSIAGSRPASLEDVSNNRPAEEANRHRLFHQAVQEEQWRQARPEDCSSITASDTSTEKAPVAAEVSSKAAGKRRAGHISEYRHYND
ncbi:hypothetical protein AMS68_001121 [Peltaster fructicola]|uniref:Uncharacterized protein n=1 Tax=Peltaster fructicola TaxID=286661 RepID=A0A6H0XLK2_9PEZI|nr:hypothetical protein AMS68_001121 [Peltaster fructicola]